MPYKDKKKQKEAQKRYYLANKEKYIANHKRRKQEYREWFVELKSTLKCERCPENHPSVLDFHHINDDKEGGISEMVSHTVPKERILVEIEKCIILCANCHRKLHWNLQKGSVKC